MSEPQRPRSIPEYTDSISIVIVNWITQANVYMDHLEAERDKLQGVVFAYRLALLADGVPAKVLDEIANGVPQEAKP